MRPARAYTLSSFLGFMKWLLQHLFYIEARLLDILQQLFPQLKFVHVELLNRKNTKSVPCIHYSPLLVREIAFVLCSFESQTLGFFP